MSTGPVPMSVVSAITGQRPPVDTRIRARAPPTNAGAAHVSAAAHAREGREEARAARGLDRDEVEEAVARVGRRSDAEPDANSGKLTTNSWLSCRSRSCRRS